MTITPTKQYLRCIATCRGVPIGLPAMPDLAGYLTTEEAAKKLGYHIEHIRRMLREGDLTGKKIGYMWFVSLESVEHYAKLTANKDKHDPRRGND